VFILSLITRWRCVVNITPQLLFFPGKNNGTHFTGGWLVLRVGLDGLEKRKTFAPTGIRTLDCSGRSAVTVLITLIRLLQSQDRTHLSQYYFGFRLILIFNDPYSCIVGRDSSVGIATHYGLDGARIESRWGARFSAPVQIGPGAYPASYTVGTGSFPGVKRPGCGVDHSPLLAPRLQVKNLGPK
jgi:hypothetical protein